MRLHLRVLRGAFAVVALAVLPAAAQTLKATYVITLLSLPIGTASVKAEIAGGKYSVEGHARLLGVASLVNNASGASSGHGAIVDGRMSPSDFATTASNSTSTRTIRMAVKDNAVAGVDIAPPFDEKPDRVPLRPEDKRNIIDPVAAFLSPAPKSGSPVGASACDRTLPIFDGYTRFDLKLSYVGEKQVSAKGYKGPVAVCNVRYMPVAGYRRDRPATKFMSENKDLQVWLAPVEGADTLAPFRISVKTMIGTLIVEASDFVVEK
jgi:hypothetical protein